MREKGGNWQLTRLRIRATNPATQNKRIINVPPRAPKASCFQNTLILPLAFRLAISVTRVKFLFNTQDCESFRHRSSRQKDWSMSALVDCRDLQISAPILPFPALRVRLFIGGPGPTFRGQFLVAFRLALGQTNSRPSTASRRESRSRSSLQSFQSSNPFSSSAFCPIALSYPHLSPSALHQFLYKSSDTLWTLTIVFSCLFVHFLFYCPSILAMSPLS